MSKRTRTSVPKSDNDGQPTRIACATPYISGMELEKNFYILSEFFRENGILELELEYPNRSLREVTSFEQGPDGEKRKNAWIAEIRARVEHD